MRKSMQGMIVTGRMRSRTGYVSYRQEKRVSSKVTLVARQFCKLSWMA
jgi:hypothetical protein